MNLTRCHPALEENGHQLLWKDLSVGASYARMEWSGLSQTAHLVAFRSGVSRQLLRGGRAKSNSILLGAAQTFWSGIVIIQAIHQSKDSHIFPRIMRTWTYL